MSAKLHKLENDARFAPVKTINKLLEDIADGKITPTRVVIAVEDENSGDFTVRSGGPGMDYVPTSIGLLYLAINTLANLCREAANG